MLQLTQLNGGFDDGPLEISIYAVAADWVEGNGNNPWDNSASGADSNSSADGVPWTTPGGDLNRITDFGHGANGIIATQQLAGFNSANDLVEFDITTVVNAWLNGSLPNYGIAMVITQGQYTEYLFASSEARDETTRPALVIQTTAAL